MTFKNKIYFTIFAILELIAVLFFLGFVAARATEASDSAPTHEIVTAFWARWPRTSTRM